MKSLRTKLLTGTIGGVIAVLLVSGGGLYAMVRAQLLRQFDHALADKARLLASTLEFEHGRVEIEFDEVDIGEFRRDAHAAYLQVWHADGRTLYRAPSLEERTLEPAADEGIDWVTLPDGRRGRAITLHHQPRSEAEKHDTDDYDHRAGVGGESAPTVRLVMARGVESMDAALRALRLYLLGVGGLAVLVAAGILWLVVGRSLRPVDELAEQIGRRHVTDLGAPLDVRAAPAELAPVIARLNEMMGRVAAAFERERSFSADVAHEMRTPLAGLRTTLEVALADPRNPADEEGGLRECLDIVTRMQSMVENLLSMARLESGEWTPQCQTVDVADIVEQEWRGVAERASQRGLEVHRNIAGGALVDTDAALLGIAVRNLLDNAVSHANAAGRVTISLEGDDDEVAVQITNTGSQVPASQAAETLQRLWRGDAARSGDGGHCGLGLSLVDKVAAALGGSVTVSTQSGGEFCVRLSIPRRT